jgi:colanic acid/amylovoran biosynthesis glycosyltransferase
VTLLHVCGRYLPLSETFTYDLITGLGGFAHHVVATGIENLEHFPLASVSVPECDEDTWSIARDMDVRAIVCHFGPQATLGMTAALAVNRPAVTIFHGYDISRLLRDRLWVERYRGVARLGMQALCISHAGRHKLIEIGWPSDQIEVIHLGVDTARFPFVPPAERWPHAEPLRILMVARLVQKKGVAVALEATRRLRDRGCRVELRVVGDGPERETLEATVKDLQLTNVAMLGALEHARTQQEFAQAHLYIQPSVTADSGDQEGIPVSLMEAMASGLPVVSTRHSGIPELVIDGTTGYLTDEGDADGLATAIERITRDRCEATLLARTARAHVVQEFDRRRQAARFAAYFDALAAAESRRPSVFLSRLPKPRRRGLLIRSIPVGLTARKLLLLSLRYPDVQWDVLTTRGSAAAMAQLPIVGKVWTYAEGRLSLRRIGVPTLVELQSRSYDVVVVPYGDDTGAAFDNVRRAATAIGGHRRVALTLRDREVVLPADTFRWSLDHSSSLLSSSR